MKFDVSVIIVNYKTKELVYECLKSLLLNTIDINFEVFVVDNNSQDEIEDMLKVNFESVNFISSVSNVGFGAANNIAIRKSTGKYIYLLNPDTLVLNNAIKYFRDYCEENKEVGCVGGWLEDLEGTNIHSHGVFFLYWYDIFYSIGYNFKKLLNLKRIKLKKSNIVKQFKPISVDYISGASLFIPRKTLDKVGVFDESFFMYSEETDLQFRMSMESLSRIVIPQPRVIHLEGKSFSLSNNRRIMMNVSKIKFIRKHKGYIPSSFMKSVFIGAAVIGTIADLYYKEYTFTENVHYLRCILNDKYK